LQDSIVKALGIVSQYSPLSVQNGGLVRGNNAVCLRENVYEDRRGHKVDATLSNNIKNVLSYSGKILAHNGTTISYGLGTYAAYAGSYTEPTGQRIRAAEGASNLYFTTNLGIKVFTDAAGTAARNAGMPRCLDLSYALTGATGFLSNGNQCAYRAVLNRTDANKNIITSYPSSRLWSVNGAGGARNVSLTLYIPSEVQAGDGLIVYRTAQVTGTSTDISADECSLVYQYTFTSSDITAGFITFTDSVTDALRGAALYTNPGQETINQANERPPLAKDIALFRSAYMFYANTQTKQRLSITLVGTANLTGNTFTIGGVVYSFAAAEVVATGTAQVFATGVAAYDIDQTARSLVRVINRYASNTTIYAYYLSGPDDLPGYIMLEEKGVGASAFTIQSSNTSISSMVYPVPPVSPATNTASTSSNSVQKNALFYSKNQQFEHTPLLNYLLVGPSNKEILRIAPLRESLIIIKEEGVYRLTGESPQSFSVTPLDLTVLCKAPNSVAVVSNQVIMLSNQGVVAISETGVQTISHDIEPDLKKLLLKSNLADFTSAFGYESDRQYLLSTISDPTDTAANQTLVFNFATKTWLRWSYASVAGVVEQVTDKMYFAKSSDPKVYVERKTYTNDDFADPEAAINITSITGSTVTFTSASMIPKAGYVVLQGTTSLAIKTVSSITGGYQVLMDGIIPSAWANGAATLYPGVGFDIEWNPWTYGNAGVLKQVRAVKFLADSTPGQNSATALVASFASNFDSTYDTVPIANDSNNWGVGPWGSFAWGGGGDSLGYPTWVPLNKQYCARLSVGLAHSRALEKVSICGVSFDFQAASDVVGR
jgi:hypothetical protein